MPWVSNKRPVPFNNVVVLFLEKKWVEEETLLHPEAQVCLSTRKNPELSPYVPNRWPLGQIQLALCCVTTDYHVGTMMKSYQNLILWKFLSFFLTKDLEFRCLKKKKKSWDVLSLGGFSFLGPPEQELNKRQFYSVGSGVHWPLFSGILSLLSWRHLFMTPSLPLVLARLPLAKENCGRSLGRRHFPFYFILYGFTILLEKHLWICVSLSDSIAKTPVPLWAHMLQLKTNVAGQAGISYQLSWVLSSQTHFVTVVLSPIRVGAAAEEMAVRWPFLPFSRRGCSPCQGICRLPSLPPSFLLYCYLPSSLVRFTYPMNCLWSSSLFGQ